MPARNALKQYVGDGYYHIYNRGVEKRVIFLDEQDYVVFLRILKDCLSPPPEPDIIKIKVLPRINLFEKVELLCFVLMPNHFHLFVHQKIDHGIESFMRSIVTRYVFYFNRKYDRQGHLFQGRYKAVLVEDEPYFLHITRYIHRNPDELVEGKLEDYPYSSYPYYLGKKKAAWINTETILSYFSKTDNIRFVPGNSYQEFVENDKIDTPDWLTIDGEAKDSPREGQSLRWTI